MVKDVRVSRYFFFPTFAQIIRLYRCHNLLQTTWLHKSTNINANMWLRQRNLFSKFRATTDIFPSVAVRTLPCEQSPSIFQDKYFPTYLGKIKATLLAGYTYYISYMRQLSKCSHVVTAAFLDHEKVQKTNLKPLQLVKSEWSPPLQWLPLPSVTARSYGSTQQNTAAYSLMFNFLLL